MVIRSFLTGRHTFIIARPVVKHTTADLMGKYHEVVKKAIISSLIVTIILFQLVPILKKAEKSFNKLHTTLEVIDIPLTRYEEPPPTPRTEIMTSYPIVIKEQNETRDLRKNLEEVKLDLNVEGNNNLLTSSQFDIPGTSFTSSLARYEKGVSLSLGAELNSYRNNLTSNNPDFNFNTKVESKKLIDKSVALETSALAQTTPVMNENGADKKENTNELISINKNQFLLRESESTIGTNEYRLWNKLNAALDRLDKNRFGKLPGNVQRTGNGLVVSLVYPDGAQHEIFWFKGGKVVIRVTATRPRPISDELERAFDALIRLTF